MIDPIHNQAYQEYTRINRQKPQGTEQKFSMDSALHENPSSAAEADGVIYEPSNASKPASNQTTGSGSEPADSKTPTSPNSLSQTVLHFFQNMLSMFRKVLTAIWESKPAEAEAETEAETEVEVETDTTLSDYTEPSPDPDSDIKNALKAGDAETFKALLSQDGRRLPAKNSSLLTYYDSRGKLVDLDPSEQYRILHGDRGSRKS